MREGCESESWDRLAYFIGVYLASQGNKNINVDSFHKFRQQKEKDSSITKEELHSLKSHFKD